MSINWSLYIHPVFDIRKHIPDADIINEVVQMVNDSQLATLLVRYCTAVGRSELESQFRIIIEELKQFEIHILRCFKVSMSYGSSKWLTDSPNCCCKPVAL
jgi:hypothetical protein